MYLDYVMMESGISVLVLQLELNLFITNMDQFKSIHDEPCLDYSNCFQYNNLLFILNTTRSCVDLLFNLF